MADSNQLKVADLSSFGDDDPFAELTKIMGFDPRVPVGAKSEEKPVLAPVKAVAPAPVDAAFESASVQRPRPVQPATVQSPPAHPVDVHPTPVQSRPVAAEPTDDFSIDLEKELFAGFDDEPVAHAVQPVAPAPRSDAYQVEQPVAESVAQTADEVAFDFESEFAASLDDELSLDELASAKDEPPAAYDEPEFELDDETLALEFDEQADVLPAESAPVSPVEPAASAQAVSVDPRQEEIDLDFDLAMAEVDMDFGSLDDDFGGAADQASPVLGSAAPRRSFETEPYARDFEPVETAAAVSYSPVRSAATSYATAAPVHAASYAGASAAPHAAEPEELSLEDELNALLGNRVAPAVLTADYDHSPVQPVSASTDADWGSLETSRPALEEDSFAIADHQGDHLAFDDNAFDAAFEDSLVAGTPVSQQAAEQDPYAYLQDMAAKAAPSADTVGLYRNQSTPSAASYAAAPLPPTQVQSAYRDVPVTRQRFADDMPEVETVDIPEAAVAFADDLDIPELAYDQDTPATAAYDDFENDFAGAFGETVQQEEPVRMQSPAPAQASFRHDQDFHQPDARYDAAHSTPRDEARPYDFDDADADYPSTAAAGVRGGEDFRDFDYDEDLDEELAVPAYQENNRAGPGRGLLIAAVVGGVALLGGIGAFALSFGDSSGGDVPAVVRADDGPIKVRPENPGGTVVPNQENKVFETMAGNADRSAPAQERLITTAEEPVDMAARSAEPSAPAGDPAAKGEDRIDPATAGAENPDSMEVAAGAPRKVKTMVVRADGTLVPREEPAPVSAEAVGEPAGVDAKPLAPATEEPALAPGASSGDGTGSTFTLPGTEPVAVAPETTATTAAPAAEMPAAVPVAPSRPADQPVDVVGEVKPDQVAAVATAAPTGAYAMQIASQPTEAGARETYQDLARRYASVIGGRDASIVKAEIPGKGTFWRVRIAASSRNEAVSLCESYKSAGGNCFVSK